MIKKIFEWVEGLLTFSKRKESQTAAIEGTVSVQPPTPLFRLAPRDWERIEEAMETNKPLTCQVLACKKGGYTVSILGTYAFLPNTLAHYKKSHTPDRVLGRQLKVYVRSVKDSRIVVSHIEFVNEAFRKLAVGDVYNAVVAKILDGRLLVYMPDNELYATVSQPELSWHMDASTGDYYPGQQVNVRIVKMTNIDKIQASIRQASGANPYEKCINDYHEGDVLTVKIVNVVDFGAFVKITEGVVGLLHRSEVHWDEPAPNMKDIFKYGDILKVMICRIDHERSRIFLSLKRLNMEHITDTYKPGSVQTATIANVTDKYATLELPYGVKSQVRALRFAKAGIKPQEGKRIDVTVLSYSPERNEIKVALKTE